MLPSYIFEIKLSFNYLLVNNKLTITGPLLLKNNKQLKQSFHKLRHGINKNIISFRSLRKPLHTSPVMKSHVLLPLSW